MQDPLALHTWVDGISGSTLVGEILDSSVNSHGFLTTLQVPEPNALALGGLGALLWIRTRRRPFP